MARINGDSTMSAESGSVKWTLHEEQLLQGFIAQGLDRNAMARRLGRTVRSVNNKICAMQAEARRGKATDDNRNKRTQVAALTTIGVPQMPPLKCFELGKEPNAEEEYLADRAIAEATAVLRKKVYGLQETGAR